MRFDDSLAEPPDVMTWIRNYILHKAVGCNQIYNDKTVLLRDTVHQKNYDPWHFVQKGEISNWYISTLIRKAAI